MGRKGERVADSYNETVFEIEGDRDHWTVSTGQSVWRNRLFKLAEEHPDEVKCLVRNEDGSVMFHIPKSYLAVRPPKKMNFTEEQKQAARERLRAAREQCFG